MDKLEHVCVLVPEEHVSGIQQTSDEMSCNETIQMYAVLILKDCSHGAIATTIYLSQLMNYGVQAVVYMNGPKIGTVVYMNGPKIGTVQAVVYINGPKIGTVQAVGYMNGPK